jgi:acyl carrier protein
MVMVPEELREFLEDLTQTEMEIKPDSLVFEELGLDSVGYLELVFFMKQLTGKDLNASTLGIEILKQIEKDEGIIIEELKDPEFLNEGNIFNEKLTSLMRKTKVRHLTSLIP